jgi:hypothetical protein
VTSPLEHLTLAKEEPPPGSPPTAAGRPLLEVADIFRDHGGAWRDANRGHVSLDQLKVMGAIESCRTAALGGCDALRERGLWLHHHRLQQLPYGQIQ